MSPSLIIDIETGPLADDRLLELWSSPSLSKTVLAPGSQPGILGDRKQLTSKSIKQFWKLEGGSDLLSFLSISDVPSYVGAFTNSSGCNQKPFAWIEQLVTRKKVVILHDCDEPGQEGAARWREAMQRMGTTECKIAKLPYSITPDHGKDLRDYLGESYIEDQLDSIRYSQLSDLPQSHSSTTNNPTRVADEHDPSLSEGDTNPQRLARVILQDFQIDGNPAVIRYFNDEWYVWTQALGVYKQVPHSVFASIVFGEIRRELERCTAQRQAVARPGEVPLVPSISITMQNGVLNAMKERVTLNHLVTIDSWVDGAHAKKFEPSSKHNRKLIALKNGLFDLQAFLDDKGLDEVFVPHTPHWFSLTVLPYEFDPAAPNPTTFLNALYLALESDQQRIDLLQEWMG
jgi:5S rRNA maturation endonuclease (ribonuclease M5)